MGLEKEIRRITNYLNSDKSWPVIVDFQTRFDLDDIKNHFNVGENKFVDAKEFCSLDGTFKFEEFYDFLANNTGISFVTGVTVFLKLYGEEDTIKFFKNCISQNVSGHVVIITYQCKNFLRFSDPRIMESGRVIISSNEPDSVPGIVFVSPDLAEAFDVEYTGFSNTSKAFETPLNSVVYISTDINKELFKNSVISFSQMTNGYEILCERDSRTRTLPRTHGNQEQWNYAFSIMGKTGNWDDVANDCFGSVVEFEKSLYSYPKFPDKKKWLFFTLLSIFGSNNNEYIQCAVNNTINYENLIKSIFRTILNVDYSQPEFWDLYEQRKDLIKHLVESENEFVEYCKVISTKGKDAIYYLTDVSQFEKERIIEWLDKYGIEFSSAELSSVLSNIYPEISAYLADFRFKNALLDSYFSRYKYQKVVNKVFPDFMKVVDTQSNELGFVDALPSRIQLIERLSFNNSQAYFFDALGVEYLGYIQTKCLEYGLSLKVTCARSELPSLTSCNKDFIETFKNNGIAVKDIKELDEIKHHGENNYDYEKVKIPLYFIKELEIIDDVLKNIQTSILSGKFDKAIIVSDHGASRLAVLYDNENIWKMSSSGVHSGRCCPKNEIDIKPDFAIDGGDYWVLANYDRFKGGRKANCEVHGGATIEEVAVPIIEITAKEKNVETFITDDSRIITLAVHEYPILKIYASVDSNNISVKINDSYYDADATSEKYIYKIELKDIVKKGSYSLDIYLGSECIAKNLKFEIKKKGMSEVSLFD